MLRYSQALTAAMKAVFNAHQSRCPASAPWGTEVEIHRILSAIGKEQPDYWKIDFPKSKIKGCALLTGELPKPEQMPLHWKLHLMASDAKTEHPMVWAEPTLADWLSPLSTVSSAQLILQAGVKTQCLGSLPLQVGVIVSDQVLSVLREILGSDIKNTLGTEAEAEMFRANLKKLL